MIMKDYIKPWQRISPYKEDSLKQLGDLIKARILWFISVYLLIAYFRGEL